MEYSPASIGGEKKFHLLEDRELDRLVEEHNESGDISTPSETYPGVICEDDSSLLAGMIPDDTAEFQIRGQNLS